MLYHYLLLLKFVNSDLTDRNVIYSSKHFLYRPILLQSFNVLYCIALHCMEMYCTLSDCKNHSDQRDHNNHMEISLIKKYAHAPIYYDSAEQPLSITLFIEHLVGDILVDIEIMLIKFKNKMLSVVTFSQVLLEHRNTQGLGKIKFINIIQIQFNTSVVQ